MQGKKQFSEKLFTSFQLSQRVPEDNFYRRLKEILDLQWLYKATKTYYVIEGQQSIDPAVFFKPMLIGYLENLGSDRRIISTVSLQSFITTPVNQQAAYTAPNGDHVRSIKAAYIQRFGNNNPSAKLPTEQ